MTSNTLTYIAKTKTKENPDIFADLLRQSINAMFKSLMFLNSLKLVDVTPLHKAEKTCQQDQLVYFQLYQKFNRIMLTRASAFWTMFSQNINADFKKAIVLNIPI